MWDLRGEGKKVPTKTIQPGLRKEPKKKVNLSSPNWLSQGQGGTKKVHPSVKHPFTLVHW
jgi:hypothetical protein